MVKVAAIDLGGVLVKVHHFYMDGCKYVLAYLFNSKAFPANAYGFRTTPDEIGNAITMSWEIARLNPRFDSGRYGEHEFVRHMAEIIGYIIPDNEVEGICESIFYYMLEESELMPQVKETLKKIEDMGLLPVLASDITNNQCSQMLVRHGLARYDDRSKRGLLHVIYNNSPVSLVSGFLHGIYTSEDWGPKITGKPFKRIQKDFGVNYAELVLVDNNESNIKRGKALGMHAIKVEHGWPMTESTVADFKVKQFREVPSKIELIRQS